MPGLTKVCKLYGRMTIKDKDGNSVVWLYDYAQDKPRLQSEMTKEEINASEKARWMQVKDSLKIRIK